MAVLLLETGLKMATADVEETPPDAAECASSCGGHPGGVCFNSSAVADVSIPCSGPILEMKEVQGVFFFPSVHLCSTGAFLIVISSGS